MSSKPVWLDCDPGHDDAIAILLAIHIPGVNLVGVSTVHGNTLPENTFKNAQRCLYAFGAPPSILVYQGAPNPLLKAAVNDPQIHGVDGLGGVKGLPNADHPGVQGRIEHSRGLRAIEGIAKAVQDAMKKGNGQKLTIVSTGPMTNIALFVRVYPDLLDCVEEFVFMGGGIGMGNRSAVAENNIMSDCEAAQIVMNVPVKKTMIPLNVTHTVILNKAIHASLLDPSYKASDSSDPLPGAKTPLRGTLSSLMTHFAEAYKSTFGFTEGPPLHDTLTIAYVARPDLFTCSRRRVDVELTGKHTCGETVVDIWNYRKCDDSWGRDGKNCQVAERIDVNAFFRIFLECVDRCDAGSPLNTHIRS